MWAPATKTEERAAPLFTMYIHYSSKDWVGKILGKMLLKECSLRLYLFDQKYKYLLKCNLFLWWQSWIFSIITPVSSVTWFFRKHSNMLIWCSKTMSYYYHFWNSRLNIFVETVTNGDIWDHHWWRKWVKL